MFGILVYINGKVMEVGMEMWLVVVEKWYFNGELDIRIEGICFFWIEQFFRQVLGKLYVGVQIDWLEYMSIEGDIIISMQLIEFIGELFVLLSIDKLVLEDLVML